MLVLTNSKKKQSFFCLFSSIYLFINNALKKNAFVFWGTCKSSSNILVSLQLKDGDSLIFQVFTH